MTLLLFLALPLAAQQPVTYARHIAPILFEHCAPCHRPGEAAPFPLLTYDSARSHAGQIARVTATRYMPPCLPEPGHGDFTGSGRLTSAQIALFAEWLKQGTPEGKNPPPPPTFPTGWKLGQPDLVLHMSHPFHLNAELSDVFRNFVLPLNLTETRYVRAMELRPNNPRVIHHANLVVDHSRTLRRRDGEDGQPGFPGMEVLTEVSGEFDPDSHFLFFKPGSPPLQSPDDMAWKLDPGSDLIVNLHLQPSGRPELVDATVGLYLAKQPPTRFPMLVQLEHDGAIDIPPGSRTFTVTDHLKLPTAAQLLAVYPHAHYLGKRIEAWADLPNGERRSLLLINNWDINWQAAYTYKHPIALPAGTTLSMLITYDNSSANPRNPAHPPVRVLSGNRAADEMGHVWFQLLPARASDDDPRLLLQVALMQRRIEKYPADFTAHFNLGAALQALDRHNDAIPELTEAARLDPKSAIAPNNLAVSFLATDRPTEAIAAFRQALALDANYQSARYNLARTLQAQGDFNGALKELEHLPDDAQAQELSGQILASQKRFADSVPHFRRATALQPNDAVFQTNLGAALAQTGNLSDAIKAFERALQSDPNNQAARDNLVRAQASLRARQ